MSFSDEYVYDDFFDVTQITVIVRLQHSNDFQYAQMFYYVGFVNIVQFGWAAVQISHMAMITELVRPVHSKCFIIVPAHRKWP